jgi:hypothetical protein
MLSLVALRMAGEAWDVELRKKMAFEIGKVELRKKRMEVKEWKVDLRKKSEVQELELLWKLSSSKLLPLSACLPSVGG